MRNGNLIFDDDPEAIEVLEAESEENSDETNRAWRGMAKTSAMRWRVM